MAIRGTLQLMSAESVKTLEEIQARILSLLAKQLGLDARTLDAGESFSRYGLDSARALELLAVLGNQLGRKLPATLIWSYPNIAALARHLAGDTREPVRDETALARPSRSEPIAIVGMACRFPGANDVGAYWKLLREGRDAIQEVPSERFDTRALSTRWAGFLEQVDRFDPQFFGISPREALHMDPQQRLMLELAWEVLEDAGIPPHTLKGSRTGVFCGVTWNEYASFLHEDLEAITSHSGTGRSSCMIANRVSYVLGLQGPSMSIDTACSSSLVAVHLACESLQRGESTVAIAGGVNLILSASTMVALSQFGALSPDGRSKAFDARADGFGRGEGAGAVLLKPLSRALADGDRVYCVILGSAVNNDGESNGLTAPNPRAQEAVLRDAYARAGRDVRDVHYVETHGTGTPLGDPIEARALGTLLCAGRPPEDPLLLGAVKTNIGHLEAAAGIAGLMKLALSIHHRLIPPNLQFQSPNPLIPFEELSLKIARERCAWPHPERLALGGVSSFGWGGTNCHVVLEEHPQGREELLLLSADSAEGLRARARTLAARVASAGDSTSLRALCAAETPTARGEHAHRLALTVKSTQELVTRLEQFVREQDALAPRKDGGGRRKIVFVCAPVGSHWRNMAWELLQSEPVFRATLEQFDQALRPYLDWSLLQQLTVDASSPRMDEDEVFMICTIAVQVALGELLRSWGIQPDVIVGHSLGEVAAAYLSGAVDQDAAARLMAAYGRILSKSANGTGMAFARVSPERARDALAAYGGRAFVAGSNSPETTLFTGQAEALDALLLDLQRAGIEGARIRFGVPAHCALVEPVFEEFRAFLRGIRPREVAIPWVGTLTGTFLPGTGFGVEYWCQSLSQPVQFARAIELVSRDEGTIFLELGPHPVIGHAIKENLKHLQRDGVVLAPMRRDRVREALLGSLGELFTLGVPAAWGALHGQEPARGVGRPLHLLTLSGRSAESLRAQAERFSHFLASRPEAPLGDLCHTANAGRTHLAHRLAVLASSHEQVRRDLQAFATGEPPPGCIRGTLEGSRRPKVAFLFTGQGSQAVGMGRTLFETQPVFRDALLRCDALLRPLLGQSLLSLLHPARDEDSSLDETAHAQPALFALEYALAQLWRSWGVEPDVVMGHSLGEYVAACVAGVIGLEDGLKLVTARGRLMQALPRGGEMAAVRADAARVSAVIAPYSEILSVAAFNAPDSVVLSGAGEALREVCAELEREGVEVRFLRVSHAFHSPLMEPMLEQFERVAGQVAFSSPRIRLVSNLTGKEVGEEIRTAGYWRRHIREPVRFASGMATLFEQGCEVFVEMGPHPSLLGLGAACAPPGDGRVWLPSLRRGQDDWRVLLDSLGRLHTLGLPVDWKGFDRPHPRRRVPLPAYAWQRQRYWLEPEEGGKGRGQRLGAAGAHPLLGTPFQAYVTPGTRLWETTLGEKDLAHLECAVGGTAVLPPAACAEMALAAARQVMGQGGYELAEVSVGEPLVLEPERIHTVQTGLVGEEDGWKSFQVCSLGQPAADGAVGWRVHARGRLEPLEAGPELAREPLEVLQGRCAERVEAGAHYQALAQRGLVYGAGLKGLEQVWRGPGEALGRLGALPEGDDAPWVSMLLEAGAQLLLAAAPRVEAALMHRARRVRVYGRAGGEVWGHARLTGGTTGPGGGGRGDVVLWASSGQVVAEVLGLELLALEPGSRQGQAGDDMFLALEWQPAPALEQPAGDTAAGRWLLLTDTRGVGDAVGALLQARGGTVVRAAASSVEPTSPEALDRLLREALGDGTPCRGILFLWSLDAEVEQVSPPSLEAELARGCGGTLHLVQALAKVAGRSPPRLWLVTRGVHDLGANPPPVAVSQAPLWGLGRTLAFEHPELRCSRVDLPARDAARQAEALVWELLAEERETREEEVALRPEGRYVARVVRRVPRMDESEVWVAAEDRPVRLEHGRPGAFEQLALRVLPRRAPGRGEVEVQVHAAGLRFPAEAPGLECSGRVVALGEGVRGLLPGQEVVVALAPLSVASHVTVPAAHVQALPPSLRMEEAAALPRAFLTAWYALHTLGRLREGERILIHSAASGMGLAAVQLAQRAGAELFATAETEEQRAYLRGLGIEHVLDSRSSTFVREVLDATGGEGVDVVLDSLSGGSLEHGLSVLAEDGRFIEPGGQAPGTALSPLRMSALRKRLSYSVVDLPGYAARRPERFHALLQEVMGAFEAGHLRPLPVQVFPISRAEEAFRLVAQGYPLGGVVLKMGDPRARVAVPAAQVPQVRADGRYLLTGGLGALGLAVARWLVEQGARHLLVVGDVEVTQAREQLLAELRAKGARVDVFQEDFSAPERLAQVLEGGGVQPPLRGVIHVSGPQEDGMLRQLGWERMWKGLAPRVRAAWSLHALTSEMPLDFFVLCSSVASLIGSPGQGGSAAADAFLDALAHHRRALGLPALTLNWGAFAGQDQPREGGALTAWQGAALLSRLLRADTAQLGVVPVRLQRWIDFYPQSASSSFLSALVTRAASPDNSGSKAPPLYERLCAADPSERPALVQQFVREQLGHVLKMAAEEIDLHTPVVLFGIDSLMAIELRNRVQAGLALASLQSTTFRQPLSVRELAPQLLQHWTAEQLVNSVRADPALVAEESEDWEVVTL
jgi:acyl transferase domain-containing protein/acyl carrier protein